jgi:hypothetical protein
VRLAGFLDRHTADRIALRHIDGKILPAAPSAPAAAAR